MKILVTGSSGFIGYHLVKKLLANGHEVIGIDNHNDYYKVNLKEERKQNLEHQKFKFYCQDINDIQIEEKNIDLAINLAAQAGVRVPKDKYSLYKHSNIKGFESLCRFCSERKINKIIYASSSSVYSDNDTKSFIEHITKIEPKSKYGESKLANEIYASELVKFKKISVIGLRFFSVYGPWGRPDMAYFLFTESIKNRRKIVLNNAGSMERDMTYIDDIINGILGAIEYINQSKEQIKNEIFNLGNNSPISTKQLLQSIEDMLGIKANVAKSKTKNEAQITNADITRAKNLLRYQPKIDFKEGLKKFLDWHEKQRS